MGLASSQQRGRTAWEVPVIEGFGMMRIDEK